MESLYTYTPFLIGLVSAGLVLVNFVLVGYVLIDWVFVGFVLIGSLFLDTQETAVAMCACDIFILLNILGNITYHVKV